VGDLTGQAAGERHPIVIPRLRHALALQGSGRVTMRVPRKELGPNPVSTSSLVTSARHHLLLPNIGPFYRHSLHTHQDDGVQHRECIFEVLLLRHTE
jgi:hypothetical protein